MAAFGADGRCLMRALREELDDPDPQRLRRVRGLHRAALRRPARSRAGARRGAEPALAPAAARRQEDGARPRGQDAEARRRRARRGGPRARPARRRRLGPAGPGGAARRAASTTSWSRPPPRPCGPGARRCSWVAAVPSRRSGPLVPDFAQRLAAALGLPFHPVLERVGDNPPQREMTNSVQQVANVRGEFAVVARPAARGVPAGRRHPLQRLDAGDGRGPAAAQGRRARLPACARPPRSRYNLMLWSDPLCSGSAGPSPAHCSRGTLKRPSVPCGRRWTAA